MVEDADIAVVGEAEVAYAAGLSLLQEKVEDAVVDIALLELLHAVAHADAVQQEVVQVVRLQFLHRVAVHGDGGFAAPRGGSEVGQFGGYEVFVTRMPAQGDACSTFGLPLTVGGGGIEVVHAVVDGIVHQLVHHLLVYLLIAFAGTASAHGGEAHHAEAQERHTVAGGRVDTVGHLPFRGLLRGGCRAGVVAPHARCQSGGCGPGCSYGLEEVSAGDCFAFFI